jgi:hypothetical protein
MPRQQLVETMKLKLDEQGHAVLTEGKPVYVHDDGKEIPFDAPNAISKISQLNGEAKGHRERAEAAETKLKTFEAITDPAAALRALDTVKNLDAKKLVDAGDVEKVKLEAIAALKDQYEPKIKALTKERDDAAQALQSELIGGAFARSPLIVGDKATLAIPADLVQAKFGTAFKVESGKVVGYENGKPIYSRTQPGEVAGFDEALGLLIEKYPGRDAILKSSGAQGGGARGGSGTAGGKTLTRDAFETKSPAERSEFFKNGGTLTD